MDVMAQVCYIPRMSTSRILLLLGWMVAAILLAAGIHAAEYQHPNQPPKTISGVKTWQYSGLRCPDNDAVCRKLIAGWNVSADVPAGWSIVPKGARTWEHGISFESQPRAVYEVGGCTVGILPRLTVDDKDKVRQRRQMQDRSDLRVVAKGAKGEVRQRRWPQDTTFNVQGYYRDVPVPDKNKVLLATAVSSIGPSTSQVLAAEQQHQKIHHLCTVAEVKQLLPFAQQATINMLQSMSVTKK